MCDKKYLTALSTTIYFIGVMIGGAVFGQLGDIFGRKKILLVCLYSPIALGIGIYFSTSYEMFTALRFFIGFFIQVGFFLNTILFYVYFLRVRRRSIYKKSKTSAKRLIQQLKFLRLF